MNARCRVFKKVVMIKLCKRCRYNGYNCREARVIGGRVMFGEHNIVGTGRINLEELGARP